MNPNPSSPHDQSPEQRLAARVLAHPKFQQMARQKSILGWSFSAMMFLVYVGFILVIGLSPETLAAKVNPEGVTTWGIYVGIFVIVFSFVITAIYVHIANGKFDKMTREVVDEVMQGES